MRRVVITGLGVISPIGNDVNALWNSIEEGVCGIAPITHFDTSDYKVKLAAEVKDLDMEAYFSKRDLKFNDRFTQFARIASKQAMQDAGFDKEISDADRFGCIIGSGIGGIESIELASHTLSERGASRVSPFFIPMALANLAAGQVAIDWGLKGATSCVVTACAAGSNAIGEAFHRIRDGYEDVMLAGGSEAAITPLAIAGFQAMRALHTGDDAKRASIPFDKQRSGFVMGEGSGALVLEELEHAKARGAKIYAEVVGYGMSGDAYHITAPSGDGAYRAMKQAAAHAKEHGIELSDIGYINAHGTSTPAGDVGEAQAGERLFGENMKTVSMSSTKSAIGHLLGAAGAVEAVLSVKALQDQICPPTLNLENPADEVAHMDLVPLKAKPKALKAVMSNSFGFGGTNSSLIFKKYEA